MTFTDKHIVEAYSELLEGLSSNSKMELIENLSKSLKKEKKNSDKKFYASFGAFSTEKSPEEIVAEIKSNRTFKKKDIEL